VLYIATYTHYVNNDLLSLHLTPGTYILC
jgi:hypothetical protein